MCSDGVELEYLNSIMMISINIDVRLDHLFHIMFVLGNNGIEFDDTCYIINDNTVVEDDDATLIVHWLYHCCMCLLLTMKLNWVMYVISIDSVT